MFCTFLYLYLFLFMSFFPAEIFATALFSFYQGFCRSWVSTFSSPLEGLSVFSCFWFFFQLFLLWFFSHSSSSYIWVEGTVTASRPLTDWVTTCWVAIGGGFFPWLTYKKEASCSCSFFTFQLFFLGSYSVCYFEPNFQRFSSQTAFSDFSPSSQCTYLQLSTILQ